MPACRLRLLLTFAARLAALSTLVGTSAAADLTGRAVGIADGDTFTLALPDNRQLEVRLGEVDAPESDQPHGAHARSELRRLIADQRVRVVVQDVDRLGRTVGRVYAGDIDVCAAMVEAGAAWAYRRYVRDESLLDLESEARNAGRGLWAASARPVPPWEWRHHRPAGHTDPERCTIKGNVNDRGERIYHLPGQRYYDRTQISPAKGERYFCSEAEARAAGWRPSRQ
jgi:endonuclease YncB( thermonuclease family)